MRVADTSALYAALRTDDAHHKRARQALADAEHVLVPSEVMAELVNLVQFRHGAAAARATEAALRGLPHLEVQPTGDDPWEDMQRAVREAFARADGRLSYTDAVVVAWCRKRGVAPWTYDKRITAAAGGK